MVKDSVKFLVDTMIKHAKLHPPDQIDGGGSRNTVRIPRGKIPQGSRDGNCMMC